MIDFFDYKYFGMVVQLQRQIRSDNYE